MDLLDDSSLEEEVLRPEGSGVNLGRRVQDAHRWLKASENLLCYLEWATRFSHAWRRQAYARARGRSDCPLRKARRGWGLGLLLLMMVRAFELILTVADAMQTLQPT